MDYDEYRRTLRQHRASRNPAGAASRTTVGDVAPPWRRWLPWIVNALPLLGVAFLGWRVSNLLWAYWGEAVAATVIVGIRAIRSSDVVRIVPLAMGAFFLFGQMQFLVFMTAADAGDIFLIFTPRPLLEGLLVAAMAGTVLALARLRSQDTPHPWRNILVLHLTIVLGGFVSVLPWFGGGLLVAVLFVALKTAAQEGVVRFLRGPMSR